MNNMKYNFYGSDTESVHPINLKYKKIIDQRHLYDLLSEIWDINVCAPRLRNEWSKSNKSCGCCTVTCLLVQDIFGGEIYGVYVDGNVHCFSKVNDVIFDLTSEQFGNKKLNYTLEHPQSREFHLSNPDKLERYTYLLHKLEEKLK